MSKRPVILIVADAFRHDYINMIERSFIGKCAFDFGSAKVEPSIGFCERTELITGVPNSESGLYGAHTYDPENSPYHFLQCFLKALSIMRVEHSNFLNRIVRRALWAIVAPSGFGFHPANIPLTNLAKLSLTEDSVMSIMNTHSDSLFQLGRRYSVAINTQCFTGLNIPMKGDDKFRRRKVVEKLDQFDVHLLYQADMDRFGHLHGPESDKFRIELKNFDDAIKSFYTIVKKKNPACQVLFLGDHGMTNVVGYIDTVEIKNTLNTLELEVEMEYFLDSTSLRIWVQEGVASSAVSEILSVCRCVPNTVQAIRVNTVANYNMKEILLQARPGFVFTPDFFALGSKKLKGMHGYDPKICEDMLGFFCCLDGSLKMPQKTTPISLTDVQRQLKTLIFSELT